ncbi:MAG: hypothetical protein HY881_10475 [Deltaproteobacteria bacterium]|nr:hypothetical protein [Deltaproteobacteria bacterium]
MIIFDGTYRWKVPTDSPSRSFRKKWEMSCDLKVIDLSLSRPEVTHLKRYVVVASETTPGPMKTSVADTMGMQIFRDFKLNRHNVLWIEGRSNHFESLEVANFSPDPASGMETQYRISWRPILSNELLLIRAFLPESFFAAREATIHPIKG